LLTQPARQCTGRFAIDEDVLREAGVRNFDSYAYKTGVPLLPDLFLN
jgi:citronellol/citronellal dehydrogenase